MVLEDRISNLPCDILIHIISLLDVKEATLTSILSTRWRNLHYYANCLNFPNRIARHRHRRTYFSDFENMVDRVMYSNRATRIKMFRVEMISLEQTMLDNVLRSNLIRFNW